MPRLTEASLLAAGLVLTGCESPTQLVVLIDSDYSAPNELAAVQVLVDDEYGEEVAALSFDLIDEGLPFSFGLEAKGDLKEETVEIRLQGLGPGDVLLTERKVTVGFVVEERRLLPIFLARSCAGSTCGAGQTCSEAGCIDPFLDVFTLPEVEEEGDELGYQFPAPGDAGRPDAGRPDAGRPDAGRPDTGSDGGRPDGGDPDPPDGGGPPDAGMPDDCALTGCAMGEECFDLAIDTLCQGPGQCVCRQVCDPFDAAEECPTGMACFWVDPGDPYFGVCLDADRSTLPNFRSECLPGDCDNYENFICHNAFDLQGMNIPGECTSHCRTDAPELCPQSVPGTTCVAPPGQPLGRCLELPPPLGDTGASCTGDAQCATGHCSQALGQCNTTCAGLTQCPGGTECLLTDAPECVLVCQDDTDCSINTALVCRTDLVAPGAPFAGICFERCEVTGCPNGGTCDPMTGICL